MSGGPDDPMRRSGPANASGANAPSALASVSAWWITSARNSSRWRTLTWPILEEWVDVIILAFDGAWRMGATPEEIIAAVKAKQAKNEARSWPDWRLVGTDHAIEHTSTPPPPAEAAASDGGGGQ